MTPGRVFVLLILAVGGIGSIVNGADFYVRILYLGILLLLLTWLLSVFSLRGIRVDRKARTARAAVGDIFEEHFEIINESRIPKLWVEITNATNIPKAAGSRVITFLRGRQKRSYTARTWITSRGGFTLGPTAITSGDPFGIFRVSKQIPANSSLVALPMLVNVTEFPSPPGLLPGGKVIRRKSLDITPHAAGVREYVPGDSIKRIHWQTSARRNQLMVKEFEKDPQAEVWLFLDTQKGAHIAKPGEQYESPPVDDLFLVWRRKVKLPSSTLEYAITITASLAHYFLGQRRSVGLVSASGREYTVIPAERSERQEAKILEELAYLQDESTFALPALVTAQMGQLPQGSSAILVTPTISNQLLLAVDTLQRRSLKPLVVLLMIQSFGMRANNDNLARALEERNVYVCRVYCESDLSEVLSTFYSKTNLQERSWQRPVLSHLI